MVSRYARLSRFLTTTPKWAWITAGVTLLVLVVVGVLLSEGKDSNAAAQDSQYGQHPEDVKIVSCAERGGYAMATFRVTNSSLDESTYALQIDFEAANGATVYGTQTVIVPQLQSHQTSAVQQVKSAKRVSASAVTCVVTRAARYGS